MEPRSFQDEVLCAETVQIDTYLEHVDNVVDSGTFILSGIGSACICCSLGAAKSSAAMF